MRVKTMSYRMIFFMCLMMVAEIRAQCDRPRVGGNVVLITETDKPNFPEGSTAKFKCLVGYEPVNQAASKSITCNGKVWTDLQLECQKKSCGSLRDIPNGKYLYDEGIQFGSRVTAICNNGFILVGENTRNCRDGGWDGRDPFCEVVRCAEPPKINNGHLDGSDKDEYEYGEAVTYSCISGYTPNGTLTISCSADGTFQPSPPHCLKVACNDPDIQNGIRIEGKAAPYEYKNFVRYKCQSGYKMEGDDYLTCEENGWDPPPPKCISLCDRPNVGGNRVLTTESDKHYFTDGSTAEFKCSDSYEPVNQTASKSITCSGKVWTALQLECKKKSCGSLHDIPNGKYLYNEGIQIGSRVIAVCNNGYKLVGKNTRNCQDIGWDGRDPVCKVVKCTQPQKITNGHLDGPEKDEYEYGEAVTYSCISGYTPSGTLTISCSTDGTFQPSPPHCNFSINVLGLGLGLGICMLVVIGIGAYFIGKRLSGKHHSVKVPTRNKDVEL